MYCVTANQAEISSVHTKKLIYVWKDLSLTFLKEEYQRTDLIIHSVRMPDMARVLNVSGWRILTEQLTKQNMFLRLLGRYPAKMFLIGRSRLDTESSRSGTERVYPRGLQCGLNRLSSLSRQNHKK